MSLFNNWFPDDDEKLMRSQHGDVPQQGIPKARPVVPQLQQPQPTQFPQLQQALQQPPQARESDRGIYLDPNSDEKELDNYRDFIEQDTPEAEQMRNDINEMFHKEAGSVISDEELMQFNRKMQELDGQD